MRTYIIFTVIGLRAAIATSVGPVTQSALVSGRDLGLGAGPEPSVDDCRLKIGAVASVEVAFAAAGPDVLDTIWRKSETISVSYRMNRMEELNERTASQLLLDELVLLESLEADGVHAVTAANVTGIEPVDFQVGGGRMKPAEEVVVGVAERIGPQSVLHTCHCKH